MLEAFLKLMERFVAAHERLAAAQEKILDIECDKVSVIREKYSYAEGKAPEVPVEGENIIDTPKPAKKKAAKKKAEPAPEPDDVETMHLDDDPEEAEEAPKPEPKKATKEKADMRPQLVALVADIMESGEDDAVEEVEDLLDSFGGSVNKVPDDAVSALLKEVNKIVDKYFEEVE